MPTSLRTAPFLPMTIPFWESRSTRISTRMRGHSHSVTRVAISAVQQVEGGDLLVVLD